MRVAHPRSFACPRMRIAKKGCCASAIFLTDRPAVVVAVTDFIFTRLYVSLIHTAKSKIKSQAVYTNEINVNSI